MFAMYVNGLRLKDISEFAGITASNVRQRIAKWAKRSGIKFDYTMRYKPIVEQPTKQLTK